MTTLRVLCPDVSYVIPCPTTEKISYLFHACCDLLADTSPSDIALIGGAPPKELLLSDSIETLHENDCIRLRFVKVFSYSVLLPCGNLHTLKSFRTYLETKVSRKG